MSCWWRCCSTSPCLSQPDRVLHSAVGSAPGEDITFVGSVLSCTVLLYSVFFRIFHITSTNAKHSARDRPGIFLHISPGPEEKNTRSDEMRNFAHQAHVGLHQSPARHRATPHIVPRSVILCHVVSQIRWPNWPA